MGKIAMWSCGRGDSTGGTTNFGGSTGVWTTRSLWGDTGDVEGWFFDDFEKKRFMLQWIARVGVV